MITGASSGIGAAVARILATRGYGLFLVARDEERLRLTAGQLRASGARVGVIAADLTSPAGRRAVETRISQAGLDVDILVNSAGAATRANFSDSDLDRELAYLELNVVAVVELCHRFVGGMIARDAGAILNVVSTAAFRPWPGLSTYAAAKAFTLSFTRTLQAELRDSPVTVTALCPGPVPTSFDQRAGFSEEEIATIPRIMWQSADDVAATAVDALECGADLCIPGRANVADSVMWLMKTKQQTAHAVTRKPPGAGLPGPGHSS